ncbi:MAG: flagellar basal body P-ring protein FlgI, partial [Planctomycetota bacterium]
MNQAIFKSAARRLATVLLAAGVLALPRAALAQASGGMRIGDICRLKGQEINTLQSVGLVVGLNGTGDGDMRPTNLATAKLMQRMGIPMSMDANGRLLESDVADSKNTALVLVTAKIPGVGAQQGDTLDVSVSALAAKSLEGGTLIQTSLRGPRTDDPTIYGLAQGKLQVSSTGSLTNAKISGGCKMEQSVKTEFVSDGKFTLIVDRDFAGFKTTRLIENEINTDPLVGASENSGGVSGVSDRTARAIDQLHVEVRIPDRFLLSNKPIQFIYPLLDLTIQLPRRSNRVVIDEEEGIVVIGKDVEIAPGLIAHRNLRIDTGAVGLVSIGSKKDTVANAKLKDLADALNALSVPTDDLIVIIKNLKLKGDLYGEV